MSQSQNMQTAAVVYKVCLLLLCVHLNSVQIKLEMHITPEKTFGKFIPLNMCRVLRSLTTRTRSAEVTLGVGNTH